MIIVQIKEGENLEKSLKSFKKKFDRIGIVKELRARKVYAKPSIVRRQKSLTGDSSPKVHRLFLE